MAADVAADAVAGEAILRWDRRGTAAFAVAATAAAAFPDQAARPAAVLDLVLFAAGLVALLVAYARALGRSRTEAVDVVGAFLLGGDVAPQAVRRELRRLVAIQVVVALVTASIRPYTAVAFGVLVPLYGIGLAGLWGATHGRFGARAERRAAPRRDGGGDGGPVGGDQADLGPT